MAYLLRQSGVNGLEVLGVGRIGLNGLEVLGVGRMGLMDLRS